MKYTLYAKIAMTPVSSNHFNRALIMSNLRDVIDTFEFNQQLPQMWIEDERGLIVAIKVHGALLWLSKVPKPPPKPEPVEICMAGT